MSKKVLLYYPSNKRSVQIETLCVEVNKNGNNLIVLTQSPKGDLQEEFDRLGIQYHIKEYKSKYALINYFFHFFYLIMFCRKHKIDTIWSQLNQCSIVSVFAQYFIKARVIVFRHHFHASIKTEGFSSVNKNERRFDKLISWLAKEIVVPSLEVRNGMIDYEKVKAAKIDIVPYIYNFDLYPKPNYTTVQEIKKTYHADLLILTASRMIKLKRHDLVLPVFRKLIEEGYSIKVLLLDEGEEKQRLQDYVIEHHLEEFIYFLGYKTNVIDYLSASDLLVHPSYTEASSSLVKEFGLLRKPVIVCSGVGDFDQYIFHMKNGFVVTPLNEAAQFEESIKFVYNNREIAKQIGANLQETVLNTFTPNKQMTELYNSKI